MNEYGKAAPDKLSEAACAFLRRGKGDHDLDWEKARRPNLAQTRQRRFPPWMVEALERAA